MKVYIVNYGYDYEGEDTRGVFSSLENAQRALDGIGMDSADSVHIYEMSIDAPLIEDHRARLRVGGSDIS